MAFVSFVESAETCNVQVTLATSTPPEQLSESVIQGPSGGAVGSAVIEAIQADCDPEPLLVDESAHADLSSPPEAPLPATNWIATAWRGEVEEMLMGEAGAVLISPAGRIVTCTGTRMDG